jgi:hypothetical protein
MVSSRLPDDRADPGGMVAQARATAKECEQGMACGRFGLARPDVVERLIWG